jgi:hypothetical protein
MIEARVDIGDTTEMYSAKDALDGSLRFVRFGLRPYRMVEFHPTGMLFISSLNSGKWIYRKVDDFLDDMEDIVRKKVGLFDPPI